jgi:long-chain acyl-CoA synthetase
MAAYLAGLVDGIVPVLLEYNCPDQRLASIVSTVEPRLVISDNTLPELPNTIMSRILNAPKSITGLRGVFGKKQTLDFGIDEKQTQRSPRLPTEDGLAFLLFTSGTTSEPTGVQIFRSNLEENLVTLSRLSACSKNSRIFNDMILAHADGLVQGLLFAPWNGCALLRAGGFEVNIIEEWLGFVRQKRATHFLTVPTVWALIDRFAAHDDYFDAPECQMLVTVAAKMPQDLWQRLEARFGLPLLSH